MHGELPLEVESHETVLRGIRVPQHVKGKPGAYRLRPAALKSQAGTDEVSVMRLTYMGLTACRIKAKEILGQAYLGLATLRVAIVRDHGSEVFDSRQWFWGHAHIAHGVILPPDEPPESERQVALNERLRELASRATFRIDPSPSSDEWSGDALT